MTNSETSQTGYANTGNRFHLADGDWLEIDGTEVRRLENGLDVVQLSCPVHGDDGRVNVKTHSTDWSFGPDNQLLFELATILANFWVPLLYVGDALCQYEDDADFSTDVRRPLSHRRRAYCYAAPFGTPDEQAHKMRSISVHIARKEALKEKK
jgi:hypothetical protein